MRKRFRGNQPIAVSQEIEGGAGSGGYQLYGGKSAVGKIIEPTDGNEERRDGG
jgi:cytochrome c oxidase assembly factor 5